MNQLIITFQRFFQNARLLMRFSNGDFKAPDIRPEWRYLYDNILTLYANFQEGKKMNNLCLFILEYIIYNDVNESIRTTFILVLEIFLGVSGAILLGNVNAIYIY